MSVQRVSLFRSAGRHAFPRVLLAVLCFVFGAVHLTIAADDATPAPLGTERTSIVVGLTSSEHRFISAAEAEQLGAYEVALSIAVAKTQGLQVSFQLAPFNELLRELAAGRIDTIPGMARTTERLKVFDFTVAHNRMNTNLFIRRGTHGIKGVADLPGKRIVVVAGSYSHEWAKQHTSAEQIVPVPDLVEAVRVLERGDADCLVAKQINIFTAMRSLGVDNIITVGSPIAELQTDLHFGVRAGDRALLAQLNEGLFTLKQTGELDGLYERWLGILDPTGNWITRHARLLLWTGGGLLGIVVGAWLVQRAQTAHTRRRLAEIEQRVQERTEELAAAKSRFEAVVASTPAAILLVASDRGGPPGGILDCNAAACQVYGYSRDALLALDYGALSESPPAAAAWAAELAAVQHHGRRQIHARHRRADGAVLEMEVFSTMIAFDGNDVLLVMGLDVTDRLRAEATLRRTEELQRLVLQAANDGIFDWDLPADRFTISARGGALLGLNDTTAITHRADWWQRIHPEDATAAERALERHLQGGEPFVHTARFRHADGSVRWLYGRGQTTRDNRGQPLRMVGSFTDVTELKRIDEELQLTRRLRAVGELVGGIAHEFNNLLTPILLQATLLSNPKEFPPELEEQVRPVLDAARRAQALTRQLLHFSRQHHTERQPQLLAAVLESTLGLIRTTIDRRIEIVADAEPGLPAVVVNTTTMGQVVMNLVLNARDALTELLAAPRNDTWRPRIDLRLVRYTGPVPQASSRPAAATWQCLIVRDNGPGIPPAIRSRVFEPFFTTKKVGEGTGLGLAMVWNSIEELGGWIELDCPPAGGTEFRLHLPGNTALQAVELPAANGTATTPGVTGRRLLLIDDDPLVGASVARLLRKLGHETTWLEHGEEALRQLVTSDATKWPDAIVTDLNMAGLSGEDLVERARRHGYRGKIVVVSGHITSETEQRLRAAGIEALLPKPFELHQLKSVIESLWP